MCPVLQPGHGDGGGAKKKRHQSQPQSGRSRREGLPEPDTEVRPLVKDDSHVSVARAGSGSRRGSLVTAGEVPGSVSACGCWCQVTVIVTNQLENYTNARAGASCW